MTHHPLCLKWSCHKDCKAPWTVVGTTLMRPDGTPAATFEVVSEAERAAKAFSNGVKPTCEQACAHGQPCSCDAVCSCPTYYLPSASEVEPYPEAWTEETITRKKPSTSEAGRDD